MERREVESFPIILLPGLNGDPGVWAQEVAAFSASKVVWWITTLMKAWLDMRRLFQIMVLAGVISACGLVQVVAEENTSEGELNLVKPWVERYGPVSFEKAGVFNFFLAGLPVSEEELKPFDSHHALRQTFRTDSNDWAREVMSEKLAGLFAKKEPVGFLLPENRKRTSFLRYELEAKERPVVVYESCMSFALEVDLRAGPDKAERKEASGKEVRDVFESVVNTEKVGDVDALFGNLGIESGKSYPIGTVFRYASDATPIAMVGPGWKKRLLLCTTKKGVLIILVKAYESPNANGLSFRADWLEKGMIEK